MLIGHAVILLTVMLPLLILLLIAAVTPLTIRSQAEWLLTGMASMIRGTGSSSLVVLCVLSWLSLGALFLRYQLHIDRIGLAAARDHDTPVDVTMRTPSDLLFYTAFGLLAGPLVIVVRAFQRPSYAYVSTESHYRDKLVYTAGRQGRVLGEDKGKARIVFDSKSYLFAQVLELLFWGGIFYLVLFENNILG